MGVGRGGIGEFFSFFCVASAQAVLADFQINFPVPERQKINRLPRDVTPKCFSMKYLPLKVRTGLIFFLIYLFLFFWGGGVHEVGGRVGHGDFFSFLCSVSNRVCLLTFKQISLLLRDRRRITFHKMYHLSIIP